MYEQTDSDFVDYESVFASDAEAEELTDGEWQALDDVVTDALLFFAGLSCVAIVAWFCLAA